MTMPCISIRQPWAWLIVSGFKDVENRSWNLPERYIGRRVLIHASAKPRFSLSEASGRLEEIQQRYGLPGVLHFPEEGRGSGGIVGVVTFTGCDQLLYTSPWAEPDLRHWNTINAKPLPFFPVKGRLGFFNVEYPFREVAA